VTETTFNLDSPAISNNQYFILVRLYYGTGYEYDGQKLWLNDQPVSDMDTYFTEINYVLLASRGYEYDGFLFS
jgi:hypothetical protein